jgi:putative ABC transport system permease protein
MKEIVLQAIENLRANKLRSFLTMFGILWGVVSIVLLSAVGEGFQRGNNAALREFGKNMGIVFPGRTSLQAGGERAGRLVFLTVDDVRLLERQSRMIRAVSPELERNLTLKSRYNAASANVAGVEPAYQDMRTIDIREGRYMNWSDEEDGRRVGVVGADLAKQLFGSRSPIGETITLNGLPYGVVGVIRKKEQDSSYSGPDNDKMFVPFRAMARDFPRQVVVAGAVSRVIVQPHDWVVAALPTHMAERTGLVEDIDWPIEREIRAILAPRHGFDPDDRDAIGVWDTSIETMVFDRIIIYMRQFFTIVGFVTLALGGIGVMNIMLIAVRERTREIGVRKALGATPRSIQRQFFLEGLFLTGGAGIVGMGIASALCVLVNQLPMPMRFAGMIVTWQTATMAIGTLALIGVASATYPARRAAELPPVEALRYEM